MSGTRQGLDTWMTGVEKALDATQRTLSVASNNDVTAGAWTGFADTVSTSDKQMIPAGTNQLYGRPGAPIRTRWLRTVRHGASVPTSGNIVANASALRLEIGYLFRDHSNWEPSTGVMVTVRTTYMHGGSYARCFIYGGYNRPWKIVPLESAGDQAIFPFFSSPESPLPHPYYEQQLSIDLPAYAQATVEVSTDIAFADKRPFFNDPWKKMMFTGVQTDLTAAGVTPQPHGTPWYTLGSPGQPTFVGAAAHFNAPGGAYHQVGFSRFNDRIRLRGLCTLNGVAGTVFTLPVGFRPEKTHLCSVLTSAGSVRLDVVAGGAVAFTGATQSWISFDGIEFGVHPTAA